MFFPFALIRCNLNFPERRIADRRSDAASALRYFGLVDSCVALSVFFFRTHADLIDIPRTYGDVLCVCSFMNSG